MGLPTPETDYHIERSPYLEPSPATRSKQPHHRSTPSLTPSPAVMALARDAPAAETPNPNERTPTTRVIAASIDLPASDAGVAIGLRLFSADFERCGGVSEMVPSRRHVGRVVWPSARTVPS